MSLRGVVASLAAVTLMACSSGTGPQGPQGDPGPQGPQGPKGEPGPAAVLPDVGLHRGLVITNEAMAPNDKMTIKARALQVDTRLLSNVDLTVDMTVNGANGRDGGARAANTWYAIFVITDDAGGNVAGLFSASGTAPALPAGYTKFRRVGWARNNGNNLLRRTRQVGNEVRYLSRAAAGDSGSAGERRIVDGKSNTVPEVADGVGATEVAPSTFFPPGVREVFLKTLLNTGGAGSDAWWDTEAATDTQMRRLARCGPNNACEGDTWIFLSEAQTFRYWQSAANNVYIEAEAYRDDEL